MVTEMALDESKFHSTQGIFKIFMALKGEVTIFVASKELAHS
jgi:hypothetical protein